MSWKGFRRWNKILHRDLGFFFIGTTFIYGLSGIALNHINDWNPSYSITTTTFDTEVALTNPAKLTDIHQLVKQHGNGLDYKSHYFPSGEVVKVFLSGGSTLIVHINNGQGEGEFLQRRPVFYQANFLHYNPNNWWKWFSDLYAFVLIFLGFSSFFMVKGKKGPTGRGGIYILAGIIIPIVFLMIFS
jgi:hypothetical protein